MIKRISLVISTLFLLNACGPSGISETISSVNEMSQTAQAVATTIDVSGQATAIAEATPVPEQPANTSNEPAILAELMDPKVFNAFLDAQSTYTFSIKSDMDNGSNVTSSTYRETKQNDPRAAHLESITHQEDGTDSVVTNIYTDTWYNVKEGTCQVNPLGEQPFDTALQMYRGMTMMGFMLQVGQEMELLEDGEFNGIPAKHYTQSETISADTTSMVYLLEWWVTDDNTVLWAKYVNEINTKDNPMVMSTTYTLEQVNEPVSIETPSGCTE
jgi:hypothetical protein